MFIEYNYPMQIVTIPNPILTKKAEKVTQFNLELEKLVSELKSTLNTSKTPGAGLACPQIAVSKRIFVAKKFFTDPAGTESYVDIVFINPEIIFTSTTINIMYEGCLSIPDTYGQVKRADKITIRYQDESGQLKKLKAEGYFARVIQHENDHLDGILFTTKVIGEILNEKELDTVISKQNNNYKIE